MACQGPKGIEWLEPSEMQVSNKSFAEQGTEVKHLQV